VLCGAVDVRAFRPPAAPRAHPLTPGRWIVGGLANKNPRPLLEAARAMEGDVALRLFGADAWGLAETERDALESGRLELVGRLSGDALPAFYQGVDCVVTTEADAGWANLAAEAMASGTPVICTMHGARAFAEHERSALVLERPQPPEIRAALERLRADPALCARLSAEGRRAIEPFSWEAYTAGLLALMADAAAGGADQS
jgi:glycosyltransferase involved in cell wall biosynthesis